MSKNTKNLTSFPLCGLLPLLADSCSLFVRIFGAQPHSFKESIIELIQYVTINVNKYTMECHKILHSGVRYHLYADNTQLYVHLWNKNVSESFDKVNRWLLDIKMDANQQAQA